MKPSALVKISAQCAEFYQDAHKQMTRDVVKGIWDKVIGSYVLKIEL